MKQDVFECVIPKQKLAYTNKLWNELKLNSPMNVGYVSNLIESRTFETKEEWRDFYYESGRKRLEEMKRLGIDRRNIHDSRYKKLATSYGRTVEELRELGKIMYQALQEQGNPLNITYRECVYLVKYRVMGETWNGIVMRERNTIQTLQQQFPEYIFQPTTGEDDYKYAVDYEVYLNNQLVAGLQIKPLSYQNSKLSAVKTVKKANELKNQAYTEKFQVPVLYVYSSGKGFIYNQEVLEELKNSMLLAV